MTGKTQHSSCSPGEELQRSIRIELLTFLMVDSPPEVHYFPSPYLAVIQVTDLRIWPLTLNSPGVLEHPFLEQTAR
jgi:hypothetical protein